MHNLTKIKVFRVLLWATFPVACIFVYPLVLFKKKKRSSLFFFFDRFAIGGAQHVYLEILESVRDLQKTVYFTRKSPDDKFKQTFYSFPFTECFDIHFWCDNLLFRIFSVHYFAFYLNRHKTIKVLSSNSTFFYDMLPFLNPHIVKIELLHNFSYDKKGMEFFGLANHGYLNYRMVIDGFTFDNIKNQYKEYNVDIRYLDRVVIAEYGVDVPPPIAKPPVPPMKILYAGRGTKQKRVWLIDKIAQHFLKASANVQFTFAGPLDNELSADVKQHSNVLGEVDAGRMQKLFTQNHVIILTSAFEGFPVVVKQGMASGCVPIVTALPANKIHLKHLSNALLIEQPDDENHVIEEAIRNIKLLAEDPTLLNTLSFHTYEYARQNFGKDNFRRLYHDLLTR